MSLHDDLLPPCRPELSFQHRVALHSNQAGTGPGQDTTCTPSPTEQQSCPAGRPTNVSLKLAPSPEPWVFPATGRLRWP